MSRALTSRSKILLRHDSKEIAQYDSGFWRSFPGFSNGMTVACFHESGTNPVAYILLKRAKRSERTVESSLSNMLLWIKSAPIADGFKFLRAFSSSAAVKGELSWFSVVDRILASTDGSVVVNDESRWLEMSKKFRNKLAFSAAAVTVFPSVVFRFAVSTGGSPPLPCIAFMNFQTLDLAPLGSRLEAKFCHDSLWALLRVRVFLAAASFCLTNSSTDVMLSIHSSFASSAAFIASLHC